MLRLSISPTGFSVNVSVSWCFGPVAVTLRPGLRARSFLVNAVIRAEAVELLGLRLLPEKEEPPSPS